MHNLTKIKLFRILLWLTYPVSLVLIYPIVQLNRRKPGRLFFFFDRYAIGGAQRVHLDILASVADIDKTVYFTRRSPNDKLKSEFYSFPHTECNDIHFWCDNLLFRLFSVHYFVFYINRHLSPVIFGSNSTFFYDILPFLNRRTRKIELLHNFSYGKRGMEFFGLANHRYLDNRLVIDENTRQNILFQYRQFHIDQSYDNRVRNIEFGVNIPPFPIKPTTPPLKILYAGRGTRQKRIWLLNRVVEHFIAEQAPVEFIFAGSMGNELSNVVKEKCVVYGEIGDRERLNDLYAGSHAIILTSAFEGFPVVIKEGMSFGCIPIVTALPGNRIHLQNRQNALLIESPEDELQVVQHAIQNINLLLSHPVLVNDIMANAYKYAKENFTRDKFLNNYRELLT